MKLCRTAHNRSVQIAATTVLLTAPGVYAMHIAEGILPFQWATAWYLVSLPFLARGLFVLRKRSAENPLFKVLVALVGAAVFIISCMPIPVPTAGTCSHPVGTGLAAILIGPSLTVVVTSIALLLQALFLAHGGLTTLGADIVSMGVAGAFAGYGVFLLVRRFGGSIWLAAFLAGICSDWATYLVTSFELASGLASNGSFTTLFPAIVVAFVPTQIPLGILEGVITAIAVRFVMSRRPELVCEVNRSLSI